MHYYIKIKKKLKNYIRKKNIKHLIHFAGCRKQDSEKSKIFAKKSTYIITKNLVDAINDSNKSIVFIYISTDHVFSGLKKRYKENNKADLIPSTNLGFYKLKSEIYIKNNLKKWFIIRSSAVADDPRQTNFILDALKKKKKVDLFNNIFFSPVCSVDFIKLLKKTIYSKTINKIFHCSGERRVSRCKFYIDIFGKLSNFAAKKKIGNHHPSDLSLCSKYSQSFLKVKYKSYKNLIVEIKKSLKKFYSMR